MDQMSIKKDETASASIIDLLKMYTTRVNESSTSINQNTQQSHIKQADQSNKPQSQTSLISDLNKKMNEDETDSSYKQKWEASEAKYRELERKYRQLETGTVKQLQNKIAQLEREASQMKLIKERIAEICSCRQLTDNQFKQLKSLVNSTNSDSTIETIANKNDFLQQTKQLREILIEHNDDLLNKIDQLIKKKRKRNQYEDDLSTDERNP